MMQFQSLDRFPLPTLEKLPILHICFLLIIFGFLFITYQAYIRPKWISPLRYLPCTPQESILWGHAFSKESLDWDVDAYEKLGHPGLFKYTGPMGSEGMVVADPIALKHILVHNPYLFVRPESVQKFIAQALGSGLVAAQGDVHKRQRRVMSGAFGQDTINKLLPVLYQTTLDLGKGWSTKLENEETSCIDMLVEMNRVTLDAIGLGCFGYDFKALSDNPSVLATVLNYATESIGKDVTSTGRKFMEYFTESIPKFFGLPTKSSIYRKIFFNIVNKETSAIIDEKRQNKEKLSGKDIISRIMASMEGDGKEYLTDDEIKGQMVTFVLAGQQNTSIVLSWVMYYLALNKDVQRKLRNELQDNGYYSKEFKNDSLPDIDALQSLPYLDSVCRETLRLEPPVDVTLRAPTEDCFIPLSEPMTLVNGESVESFFVPKDTVMSVSVATMNKSTRLWGSDAKEFRPERFMELKRDEYSEIKENLTNSTKGLATQGPLFTFTGGPRSCIGYRFAILEIKALTALIVANFEVDAPEDNYIEKIIRKRSILARPFLKDDPSMVPKLPLNIRRI